VLLNEGIYDAILDPPSSSVKHKALSRFVAFDILSRYHTPRISSTLVAARRKRQTVRKAFKESLVSN